MKALDLFYGESSDLVYIKKSKIKNAELGLFANKDIEKDKPVVIYFGDKIKDDEILNIYITNKKKYYKMTKYR